MREDRVELENVQIIFRNFSGTQTQYNPEGKRNFCVLLDPDTAQQMKADGWNVKWLEGRMEGEEPQAYLPVAVTFDSYPAKITLVTDKKLTQLDEETVDSLDWADIKNVNLVIRPYNWEVNGNKGRKAYLKTMWVEIDEDPFAEKYADIPKDTEPQVRAESNMVQEDGV